jgi:hypothetical protein
MTMKEYTKEFYRLDIRTGKREKDDENVSRYINGLRYEIQDEINMVTVRTMKDAYQIALKVEEKLARNQSQWNKRKGLNKGKGVVYDKAPKAKDDNEKSYGHLERGGSSQRILFGGRNYFPRGRGSNRGGGVKCYACGKVGNMSWECPKRKRERGGEAHISEAQNNVEEEATEEGQNLIMRKVLLKPKKETEDLAQRKRLFKAACKTKDKVCKMIIDSGSTDN